MCGFQLNKREHPRQALRLPRLPLIRFNPRYNIAARTELRLSGCLVAVVVI